MKYFESVVASGLFNEIKEADREDAYRQLRITGRKYSKNETVFLEEDEINRICIVCSGSVRGEKTYPNGDVHIVEMCGEGSIFGLEIAVSRTQKSTVDYLSNEETVIAFINTASIEKSIYVSQLRKSMMHMLADSNIRMSHKIEMLAERGLRDRIMVYLRILQSKSGTDEVTVPMNREQLAQFLCVNRSALSTELSRMKAENIIDFKGSRFIIKM